MISELQVLTESSLPAMRYSSDDEYEGTDEDDEDDSD